MGKKSTPAPPDYAAAAEKTSASDFRTLQQQTYANRPEQTTPFGGTSWSVTPGSQGQYNPATQQYSGFTPDRWSQNTYLAPEAQRALDAQLNLTADKSELGQGLTGRMQDEYGSAFDFGTLPEYGATPGAQEYDTSQRYVDKAGEALYGRATSRLDPQWEQRERKAEAKLFNRGVRPGDAAYDEQMENFNRARTDAYQQAGYGADIGAGAEASRMHGMDLTAGGQTYGQQMASSNYQNQLRQAQLAETMQQRGFSLNEINAIMSGQQVNLPSMPQFNQAGKAMATDYSGAARDQFSADMSIQSMQNAQNQALMSGVTDLAGSAMMFSDRRLKRNIITLGNGWYEFQYIWGGPRVIGMMADEAPAHAVHRHPSGYLMVDYGAL